MNWHDKKSICIVLTSKGYPEKFKKNILIQKLENLNSNNNQFIFHAGTKHVNNKFFSTGGRVLNFVALNENLLVCRNNAINLIKKLNWTNGHYRTDIGYKVIE